MKRGQQVLSVLLTLVLLLTAAPLAGFVGLELFPQARAAGLEPSGQIGDNAYWTFDAATGDLTITGTGDLYDYGDSAEDSRSPFSVADCVISATISDGITGIGNCQFWFCRNLERLYIGRGVRVINTYDFTGCSGLRSLTVSSGNPFYYSKDNCIIERLTKTLTLGCQTSIIPEDGSVTTIGHRAFNGGAGWNEVSIPDSVTEVASMAFFCCDELETIRLGKGVKTFSGLDGCEALSSFVVSEENTFFSSDENGCLYNKDKTVLLQYPKGNTRESFVVSDSVTMITVHAFQDSRYLKSIVIPNSVITIGAYGFEGCTALTSITIGTGITNIGRDAFGDCYSLTAVRIGDLASWCNILFNDYYGSNPLRFADNLYLNDVLITDLIIPDGVTEIKDFAFAGYSGLTSVEIPNSVSVLGKDIFYGCDALESITIGTGVTTVSSLGHNSVAYIWVDEGNPVLSSDEYGCVYDKEKTVLIMYPQGNPRTSFVIPEGVTSISERAFQNCTALTDVTIPDTVAVIEKGAFSNCESLTSIIIPDSVTTLEKWTFEGCKSLESIRLPGYLEEIDYDAFRDCSSLRDIYFEGSEQLWNEINIHPINEELFNATIHFDAYPPEKIHTITNEETGVMLTYPEIAFDEGTPDLRIYTLAEEYLADSDDPLVQQYGKVRNTLVEFNIPRVPVTLRIPVPEGFAEESTVLYRVIGEGKTARHEKLTCAVDGYLTVTVTEEINNFYIIDESTEGQCMHSPDEPECLDEIPATCTEDGSYVEVVHCLKCGAELSRRTVVVPATGHNDYYHDGFCIYCGCYLLETDAVDIGKDGNIYWRFDSDGTLTISGSGTMYNYYWTTENDINRTTAPWGKYYAQIEAVQVKDGVTTLGNYAFYGCGALSSVEIPNSITSVGSLAFENCTALPGITLPEGLTNIGSRAFQNCTALQSIAIPDSVTGLGNSAFYGCTNLESVTLPNGITGIEDYTFSKCTALSEVVIPDRVTTIGYDAFAGCTSLSDVSLPEGLITISPLAFESCALTSLAIPAAVTTIGASAFRGCASLESVTIPAAVESIGPRAFDGCKGVTAFLVAAGNPAFSSDEFGCLYNKDKTNLIQYPCGNKRTSFSVPDGVTQINDYAFYGCSSLTNVELPEGLTCIGDLSFANCGGLISITLPDSMTTIVRQAFLGCNHLERIDIPSSVTSIGERAFAYCTALTIYGVAGSFAETYAAQNGIAFEDPASPSTTVAGSCGTQLTWRLDRETGLLTISGSGPMDYYSTVKDNGTTRTAAPWGRYYEEIKAVQVDDGVTSLSSNAFYGCPALTTVALPDNMTSIGSWTFYNCAKLSEITIPDGVTVVDYNTFYNCSALSQVHLPDSLRSIGSSAFYGCASLSALTIPGSVTSIGSMAFFGCKALTGIAIPAGVTTIENYTFYGCTALLAAALPAGLTKIGSSAFSGCTALSDAAIPSGVTVIGDSAFYDCLALSGAEIPEAAASIGKQAFQNCRALSEVAIPAGVTQIGESAFAGCSGVTRLSAAPENEYYHVAGDCLIETETKRLIFGLPSAVIPTDGSVTAIGPYAFYGAALDTMEIPNSVTAIEKFAFALCTELRQLTIPESVTSIGEQAFFGCQTLQSVLIPSGVTSIGASAFSGCAAVSSFEVDPANPAYYTAGNCLIETASKTLIQGFNQSVIPADGSVEAIGQRAFYACTELKEAAIPASVTRIDSNAFTGCVALESLTVDPENPVYRAAGNCLIETESGKLIFGCGNSVIPADGTVKTIGALAFATCTGLTGIIIPEGVTTVEQSAFLACPALKNVTIPASVTKIGMAAFYSCPALENVYYAGSQEDWTAISIDMLNDSLTNAAIHYNAVHKHQAGTPVRENETGATCTAAGSYELVTYCTLCGVELAREIVTEGEALGHTWDDGVVTLEPTTEAPGVRTYTCTVCSATRTEEIPKLKEVQPGDINGDGVLNSKDLTRLMKYLAGEDVFVEVSVLDVNGDGTVNNKDLTRLMKYLAGEDVQIF